MARPGPGQALITRDQLAALLDVLRDDGWQLAGPTVRDGAIVYAEITGVADLPAGWTDEQEAGTYRLRRRDDGALFGYAVGPQSWKPYFLPPRLRLLRADRDGKGFTVTPEVPEARKVALVGARGCDLAAIAVQDRVLRGGEHPDPHYAARREDVLVVAVHCGQAGGTCFCVSMGTGPRAQGGFDLALTELPGDPHRFVVEVGSARGEALLGRLAGRDVTPDERREADAVVERTAAAMGRTLDTRGIRELFAASWEHPRWDEVAARCLACANCTLVCPTCFCTTVEDATDLSGDHAERWRRWDSCFTSDFTHLHGGSVRTSTRSRYRQWLTHKLATWIDQFDTSGCVGCGRCITWCPVGIDLTAETRALRAGQEEG